MPSALRRKFENWLAAPLPDAAALRRSRFSGNGLEAAKLAAIVLMTINHTTNALVEPWLHWGYLAGRPCVAIFAFTLVMRVADAPVPRTRHAFLRLMIWGVVAQPIYLFLVAAVALRLNVLFTLAAGAGLVHLAVGRRYFAAAAVGIGLVAVNPYLDGGALTPLSMLTGFFALRRNAWAAIWTIAIAGVVYNYLATPEFPSAAVAVLLAPAIIGLSPLLRDCVPRLPKHAFYAYYPLHLTAIFLILGPYR